MTERKPTSTPELRRIYRALSRNISQAVKSGDIGRLQQVLHGNKLDLNRFEMLEFNPLVLAVERLNHDAIVFLYKSGCDPNQSFRDPSYGNPFCISFKTQRYSALSTLLTLTTPRGDTLCALLNMVIGANEPAILHKLNKAHCFEDQTDCVKDVLDKHVNVQNESVILLRQIYADIDQKDRLKRIIQKASEKKTIRQPLKRRHIKGPKK